MLCLLLEFSQCIDRYIMTKMLNTMQICLHIVLLFYTVKNASHVIVGDLNLPRVLWDTYCCPDDYINKKIVDFVLTNSYSQL